MQVRSATRNDIPAMARIRAAGGWTGGADGLVMGRYLEGDHSPQHALAPRVMYVAEEGGDCLGFIAGHRTRRFECDGELQWIYVSPAGRGRVVASTLIRRLATWFVDQGAVQVCVNVDPANVRARAFYERYGARELDPHWLVWSDISRALENPRAPAA